MTAAHHPAPNLWIGPGVIEGEIPAGMVLQRETGDPCAIGDMLPADRCAVAREPREPPPEPTYHPLMDDTLAIREKRERLWNLMLECPACDPWDVYDIPAENLDRDIAAHGGAKE